MGLGPESGGVDLSNTGYTPMDGLCTLLHLHEVEQFNFPMLLHWITFECFSFLFFILWFVATASFTSCASRISFQIQRSDDVYLIQIRLVNDRTDKTGKTKVHLVTVI